MTPPDSADLSSCDREPIHIPGAIQPHGFLLAAPGLDAAVTHASENARTLAGSGGRAALGRTWAELFGEDVAAVLRQAATDPNFSVQPSSLVRRWCPPGAEPVELIAHRHEGFVIVEAEQPVETGDLETAELHAELAPLLNRMGGAATLADLLGYVSGEVRRITRFDRVQIYQFDDEWNGNVIAESRNDRLPSYLGHRFPAADIPAQARALYHINRLRLIASNDYTPVPLLAARPGLPPLDLTLSLLRGISPIHLEYMRNMGTGSSMSASLICEGRLWGLLSCHSVEPRRLSFGVRSACDLLGQILSSQIATRENSRHLARQVELRRILAQLLTGMTEKDDFVTGIDGKALLDLTAAHGAALVRHDEVTLFGVTPETGAILALRDWVAPLCRDGLYQTAALPSMYSDSGDTLAGAGGLLAVSISPVDESYVLWFRAELVETVLWGGDPHKASAPPAPGLRMHPRQSFDTWKETVRGRSVRWDEAELDAALGFRRAVIDIVLKQVSVKTRLLAEVQRMNKELEAFAYTVSHDLRAPFRHVRGYAEVLQMEKASLLDEEGLYLLSKILKSTAYAGDLVDTLLSFSRMNLTPLTTEKVDLGPLVERARSHAMTHAGKRSIEWRVGPLPEVLADTNLLLLALQNLFENAVKYTGKREHAVIEVASREEPDRHVISVKDNGAGFNPAYNDKLFGVFQRLHSSVEFPGLGIGLASVRRIIERHGGRVWAEGAPGAGATFFFSLPHEPPAPLPASSHA
jgi:two-component system, chemotaxis family, sensor kinase Cph1